MQVMMTERKEVWRDQVALAPQNKQKEVADLHRPNEIMFSHKRERQGGYLDLGSVEFHKVIKKA